MMSSLHTVHITANLFTVAANEVNPSPKLHIVLVESECYWASEPQFLLTLESYMNNLEPFMSMNNLEQEF
jgi:hypothetical protein